MRYSDLTLSAQTSYAELFEQTRYFELSNALAGLKGSFQKLTRKKQEYWYFAYRDLDQKVRMAYVGPDEPRVQALVQRFESLRNTNTLAPPSKVALTYGCASTPTKHFKMIKRLSEYGFFRAGVILIGSHAFLAMGNMLGVRWSDGAATLDVDFAHAGNNVSLALPSNINIDVHDALTSLEMGLLPITQFNGKLGGQYRNPQDQELRLDFLTSNNRTGLPVHIPKLNLALQPLKFMEYSLQNTTQSCVISNAGACIVNIPAPERYAVHKLIVYGERPIAERTKSTKDLLQAASLISYFFNNAQSETFNIAWQDAISRGKGWLTRATQGRDALLKMASDLDQKDLWK
jgi:hypothetical protein